ncbi:MAG TPA: hypothetical protein VJL88_04535 [Nitrospira sp.]|nr:hypothetical protein [Nitrospira sp.]
MLDVIHMALPMDGGIWRVEWIGAVRVNPFSPQELEVSVAFRQVGAAPPYVPNRRIHIERIGVSTLCKLPLGSLWRDGRYVGEHPATSLQCEVNLQTGSRRADVVSYDVVGDPKEKRNGRHGNHLIPIRMGTFYAMRIQISKPRTKLKRIIIPLFEIARSWFLRDSELTLRLTSGPIDSAMDKLYDAKQSTIVEQGQTVLAIHPGLSEGAIPTIAMLACDPYSRMVASRMVNRIVSAFMSKESVGLETLPPLQERWAIHAAGTWGEMKDKGTFYVYRMTAIQMPKLGDVEWFRLGGDEPVAAATVTTDEASPFDEFKTRRGTARVTHQLDPSARHGRTSATVEAVPMLNPPIVIKRPTPPPAKETRGTRSKASKGGRTSTEEEVSTGVAASWGEGVPSFRYKIKTTEDDDVSSRVFLPAGLKQMVIIVRHLKKDADLRIRAVGGSRSAIHPSGIVTTSLSDEFSWSLIEGKVRQSLAYEVLHAGHYFYLIEVERRYEKEELSTCLVARLDGRRFTSADIDRLLDVYARKRGSWTSVHDPYWKRTLAHKFKDVLTFSERFKSIVVKRGSEMAKEAAGSRHSLSP